MSKTKDPIEPFERLIRGTVQHREHLVWERVELERSITIEITPHGEDYGRLNGTQGANIKALKTLGDAVSERGGKIIFFSLEDSVVGTKPDQRAPFKPADVWDSETLKVLIAELIELAIPGTFFWLADGRRTTTVDIQCTRANAPVAEALKTWVRAWGKANGRDITTNIHPQTQDEELQPARADGRFSRTG